MHTNKTPNYDLPLFTTLDKPTTLGDFNGAMTKIDSGIHAAQVAADNAQETATTALDNVETALVNAAEAKTNAAEAKELATQAHEDAAEAVETAGNALTLVTALDTRVTTDEGKIAENTAAAETAQDTATRALDKATAHETRIDALEDNTGAGSESGYDVATLGTLAERIDALENGGSGNNKRTFNNPDKTVSVSGTYSAALNKLYSEIDKDKLTPDSVIFSEVSDEAIGKFNISRIDKDSISLYSLVRHDVVGIYTLTLNSKSSTAYTLSIGATITRYGDDSNEQGNYTFHIWY